MSRKQNHNLEERIRAKEWRALPQDAVLSGDTKSGTRRLFADVLRKFSVVLLIGGIASLFVYVWADMMAGFSEEKSGPVSVSFESDGGILDEKWFREWTEFNEEAVPNLHHLRNRILEYPQVSAARVLRKPDGNLRIDVRERCPVARLIDKDGVVRLVATDGIVFPSNTFPMQQAMLPILQDVRVTVDSKTGFECVPAMEKLTDFIETARTSYGKLFREWDTISLRDFPADLRDIGQPWSLIYVVPKLSARDPSHAKVSEYVFSASRFLEDLKLLAAARDNPAWDGVFGAPNHPPAYRVLFITNRKNPPKEFREIRLIPVYSENP